MQPSGAVHAYYDRYWRDGFWANNPYERWKLERVKAIASTFRPGARALDVGCGDARILAELAPLRFRSLGLDTSDSAVEQARTRGIEVRRADIDGARLPASDGEFDLVL
ncbi:MAG TPA: methionine biosynthesis protein MetW, partial [Polyangiaceae bacterium]